MALSRKSTDDRNLTNDAVFANSDLNLRFEKVNSAENSDDTTNWLGPVENTKDLEEYLQQTEDEMNNANFNVKGNKDLFVNVENADEKFDDKDTPDKRDASIYDDIPKEKFNKVIDFNDDGDQEDFFDNDDRDESDADDTEVDEIEKKRVLEIIHNIEMANLVDVDKESQNKIFPIKQDSDLTNVNDETMNDLDSLKENVDENEANNNVETNSDDLENKYNDNLDKQVQNMVNHLKDGDDDHGVDAHLIDDVAVHANEAAIGGNDDVNGINDDNGDNEVDDENVNKIIDDIVNEFAADNVNEISEDNVKNIDHGDIENEINNDNGVNDTDVDNGNEPDKSNRIIDTVAVNIDDDNGFENNEAVFDVNIQE